MHKLNPPGAFLLAAIVLTTCSFAFGQETTGSIEGFVNDSAGALVPNVTLTITNAKATASGTTTTAIGAAFRRTITTNEEGCFRILTFSSVWYPLPLLIFKNGGFDSRGLFG